MAEISAYQMQIFIDMGIDVSGFTVPEYWSDPVATNPVLMNPQISSTAPTVFRQLEGFDSPTVIQTGFSDFSSARDFVPKVNQSPPMDDFFNLGPDIIDAGFQGGPDGFDFDEPNVLDFTPVPSTGFVGGIMDILDPLDLIGQVTGMFSSNSNEPTFSNTQQAGGLAMVMNPQVITKLSVAFTLIGQAVKRTNGRIPMGKGFLSRIMQLGTGLTIANILPIDLWPFNNSSDKEEVMNMVSDALENGAISDNRAYNRSTGELSPMRAIIILYDRMGETVEQMYAVSFRPANPATTARRTSRSNNTVMRRRKPARRSR